MSNPIVVRVGGVPEHFNLPWLLAIEDGLFSSAGYDVEWIDFPGGTGAIMAALAEGEIDIATPLTEGAVTSIANGNPSTLVSVWVDSPLLWGVHASGQSTAVSIDDLEGGRFAISRLGSGSELMSRVMAEERGWSLNADSFVAVGDLAGALTALPEGDAEIFMWNLSMTQPHVDDGTFTRVGVFPTPWPSFVIAASSSFSHDHPNTAASIAHIALSRASALVLDESAPAMVAERYGLQIRGALEWMAQVDWTKPGNAMDQAMIAKVTECMVQIGRIAND